MDDFAGFAIDITNASANLGLYGQEMIEAAKANTEANFSAFFGRILDDLFIRRTEGNDEIFNRVINDKHFRSVAQ